MNWISVKDRMPIPGKCIIFVKEHNPQIYQDAYGEYEFNRYLFAHEMLFTTKVTHWMPLPEPPKENM